MSLVLTTAPLRRIYTSLTAVVFPPLCPMCRTPLPTSQIDFCPPCRESISPIVRPFCPICGEPFISPHPREHLCGRCARRRPPFGRARAYGLYQGALAEAIRRLKYAPDFSLTRTLAQMLDTVLAAEMKLKEIELVIPVPLHRGRLKERGFNQALVLAKELCRHRRLRLDYHNLQRVRHTLPQYGLTRRQREQNVHGAFALRAPEKIAGRRVLLVDDIFTTGATARECARTLKRAKAASVEVLTLARAGPAQVRATEEETELLV